MYFNFRVIKRKIKTIMKSLKKFFKSLKGNIDQDKIENYYGHGTLKHERHEHSHNGDNEHQPAIKYKCPMKCEGNKVYDTPGNCPMCNMKLVPVDNKSSHKCHHH